jgi:FkbM family methyltransferase
MNDAFLLVGPIATGKSHIGALIEREFSIPFFEYEDIFIREQKKNPKDYLKRAEPLAERAILEFLDKHGKICLENTMSRPYALDILKKMQQVADVRLIYVDTPLDTTLQRLQQRPRSENVAWSNEEITDIYEKCKNLDLKYDLVLNNTNVSDEHLIGQLRALMEERKWQKDHVEIDFKGQHLKFSSWSGENLTSYDIEYKPWAVSFKKENYGYLRHYELKPGDVVIDAGGYEGTFAIYAAKVVGKSGKVVAFEPDTENFRKLRENVALNKLENILIINKALWEKDGRLKFNNKHTAGASFYFNASPYTKETDVVTLDNELGRLGISRVDFIKMDIEGSELQALKGAEHILKTNRTNLAIASYHIINGEETSTEVENILKGFDYQAVTEFPEHKTTYGCKA